MVLFPGEFPSGRVGREGLAVGAADERLQRRVFHFTEEYAMCIRVIVTYLDRPTGNSGWTGPYRFPLPDRFSEAQAKEKFNRVFALSFGPNRECSVLSVRRTDYPVRTF